MCSGGILLGMGSCCCPETFFWRLSVAQPQQQGATVDRQGGRNGIGCGVIARAVDVVGVRGARQASMVEAVDG
jgi:hypothetical protein